MHVVNGPSQRNTAGWLKEVAHERIQRKRRVVRARIAPEPMIEEPKGLLDRLVSKFQNLFYTCCYSKEAKRELELIELAEAQAASPAAPSLEDDSGEPDHLSQLASLASPPASILVDMNEEVVYGVTNLKAANARADALFAPYIARRMQHLGSARYEHRLPNFYGTNALITIVHGELNDGSDSSLPALLFS